MLKSPLNYSGSKHDLMPQLLQHFPKPESVEVFYDVFAGGLSVTINSPYKNIVSNDIIKPLIEFYDNLYFASKNNLIDEEISKILEYQIDKNSEDDYYKTRDEFNSNNNPYLFFSLVSSCTNNMMRFNKSFKFNQSFGKRTINDSTISKINEYCQVLKTKNIIFSNFDYTSLIDNFKITKNDFVYLDPPYAFITEAGYNAYWSKTNEDNLYKFLDLLNEREIRFALSGVSIHKGIENPNLDKLKKYKIINLEHSYEKVARKKLTGESQEILVINY